jgi:hypothetical protein
VGGRGGDEALQRAVADGAFLFVRSAEALDFLELMTTIFAAIFVKGHLFLWGFRCSSYFNGSSTIEDTGRTEDGGSPSAQGTYKFPTA